MSVRDPRPTQPGTGARSRLRQLNQALIAAGVDVRRLTAAATGLSSFARSWIAYQQSCRESGASPPEWADLLPFFADQRSEGGTARGHYFHQDLWAARKICAAAPNWHVDIGSRLDGFVAHLLTFRAVTVVDIRPVSSPVSGLSFLQGDARSLAGLGDASVPSLSSLHAIEHVGLGRYGDPLDPEGWRRAIDAIQRVTAPGAHIYIGVPIGRPRTMFNAHRIFSPSEIANAFRDADLVDFAAVDDDGELVTDTEPDRFAHADYACGLFELCRRS